MRYTFTIILICFFNFFLFGKEGDSDVLTDNRNKVQFELVDGLILMPLIVDGIKGTYILDTGAPHLTLNRKVNKVDFTLMTKSRSHDGQAIKVDDIQCGHLSKVDVHAWAMDLSYIEQMVGRPIAGILGADLLQDFDLLIDFDSKEIELLAAHSGKLALNVASYDVSKLKIEGYHDQLPLVNVLIGDVNHSMIFDTGAAISVLNGSSESLSNNRTTKEIRLNNVTVEKTPFLSTDLSDLMASSNGSIDGILSVSTLNASKVLLSYSSSRVFLFWSRTSS